MDNNCSRSDGIEERNGHSGEGGTFRYWLQPRRQKKRGEESTTCYPWGSRALTSVRDKAERASQRPLASEELIRRNLQVNVKRPGFGGTKHVSHQQGGRRKVEKLHC